MIKLSKNLTDNKSLFCFSQFLLQKKTVKADIESILFLVLFSLVIYNIVFSFILFSPIKKVCFILVCKF